MILIHGFLRNSFHRLPIHHNNTTILRNSFRHNPIHSQNGQGSVGGKGGCLLCCLSLLNMGLAVLMATLGVLTEMAVSNSGVPASSNSSSDADGGGGGNQVYQKYDLSEPFLAFYMILFAVLLFCYELMWWSPMAGFLQTLNGNMRKNFGFMYGLRGKGLYLVFVAFLCFGLGSDARVLVLNYFTGISWLLAGCLHIFLICYKPEIAQEYQPPGGTSSTSSSGSENVV